ncbi:MAG TPA: tetratricopeptide repeat protein, partial [Gemmataceae bacterium]|nr:tetratricopeptide repeat protein [Gemmataceae bacterium]
MTSRDDSSSAGHLAAARQALEKEDLSAAVRHIASALGEDPNRSEALALLDEIIAAAEDPLDLIPSDDLPASSGQSAVHAYILADQDRIPEAIDKLLGVIGERPDVLYIDWVLGWLQRPEAANKLDMDKLAAFVGGLLEQFAALTAPRGGGRDTLARMPLFIQLVRRTQPADSHFLAVATALLCRLGNLDEALKLAREAYDREPCLQTAVAVASAHAHRSELDQALKAFRDALGHEPGDIQARLHMADLLVNYGRLPEAQELYAEVLEREPGQECAQPSFYFLNLVTTNEESWRDKLLALADEQPDNERAQRLAQQVTPYAGYLPDPPDLTASLQQANEHSGSAAWLPYVEAPSNYVAFDWLQRMNVSVARVQKPDPRLPRCRVDYLLWTYDDTRPRIAVPPPTSGVGQAVAEFANQPYRLEAWWGGARRLARQMSVAQVDDLLATMVYPPAVSRVERPAAWVFRVQVAAALVLAHIDGGW